MKFSLNSWSDCILATLAYTAQFLYPLTLSELLSRSIFSKQQRVEMGDAQKFPEIFGHELQQLLVKGLVKEEQGFYFLSNQVGLVKTRLERAKIAARKRREIKPFIDFCGRISFIQTVLITGALAMNNTPVDDDIDLMIITTPHRLWLSRILLTLFALKHGKRRSWRGEEKNSWCLNYWIEEDALKLPATKHSIYSAYEVLQAVPILDKDQTYLRWLLSNSWVKSYLPVWFNERLNQTRQRSRINSGLFNSGWNAFLILASWPLTGLNWLLYWFQLGYMKPHHTTELVKINMAMFHPRDTKKMIETNWQTILKEAYELR